jgi:acetyl esterase/lipase
MRRTTPTLLAAAVATAAVAATTLVPSTTASAAAQQTVQASSATLGVKTVRYGDHLRQVMDVYTPASLVGERGKKRGTVVLIHGGAWVKGDKKDFEPQARQLARRGYVVANINYRFATDAAWPAPRTDAINAVKYLRSHAWRYNVDTSRIVLIGSSAGAQLATAVATYRRGSDLVSGVIGLSGPLGMRRLAADPAGNLDSIVTGPLLRCLPTQCAGRYDSATPRTHLTRGDVPVHLFSSRHEWLNPQSSVDFVQKAQRIGLPARMVWIPGNLHARYYWDAAWPTISDWLRHRMAK